MTDAPQKIFGKMADILAEIAAIGKDQKNTSQNFQYRGIDDVYNAVNPLLVKNRVFMSAQIVDKTREERTTKTGTVLAFTCLRMRYRFIADDGSYVETEAEGEGMDSGDKSSNKAMAVAHKYALLQAFCIPTKDLDDPDRETHEVTGKGAAPQPAQHRESPKQDNTKSPAATTEEKQKAANWCFEAKAFVEHSQDAAALNAWVTKSAKALDAAHKLAPNAHKQLIDAIDQRRTTLNPLAAE